MTQGPQNLRKTKAMRSLNFFIVSHISQTGKSLGALIPLLQKQDVLQLSHQGSASEASGEFSLQPLPPPMSLNKAVQVGSNQHFTFLLLLMSVKPPYLTGSKEAKQSSEKQEQHSQYCSPPISCVRGSQLGASGINAVYKTDFKFNDIVKMRVKNEKKIPCKNFF